VALTFHGQGEPGQIEPLLRILERASVTVTVLAVGTWLDAYPDMAKRIAGGGHELGNHTQTHPALADLPAGEVFAEIAGCARRLHALTGSIGAWFRPSQTPNATALIRAQAQRAGYPTCLGYDVDSLDYTDPAPNAVAATVLGEVQNGSIVSLHFGHDATVAAMPAILAGLRERGLVAVTATDLLR
jgi:peptidoglycan/xylan/chitin deacetylase (PgdA/CDA1 family)